MGTDLENMYSEFQSIEADVKAKDYMKAVTDAEALYTTLNSAKQDCNLESLQEELKGNACFDDIVKTITHGKAAIDNISADTKSMDFEKLVKDVLDTVEIIKADIAALKTDCPV